MNDSRPAAALHFAALVASSDDAIVSKDLNGIITSWNRGAERVFGYMEAEMIGKSITTIIPSDRLNEETEVLTRIRRGESVDHFETIRQRKDGTLIPISLTVSPIRAPDGTIIGVSKIARDISDRRRAEAALARHGGARSSTYAAVARARAESGAVRVSAGAERVARGNALARSLLDADAYAVASECRGRIWEGRGVTGLSDSFVHRHQCASQRDLHRAVTVRSW